MKRRVALLAAALLAVLTPWTAVASTTVGSSVVGTTGIYDYSPSVLQTGTLQQYWWCAGLHSDTIVHEAIQLSPLQVQTPETQALTEGAAGAWDSAYVCNPHVVRGAFVNPLGDGVTYSYALYYVGTALTNGTDNSIGVAFSNDALTWVKYPTPVIATDTTGGVYYGDGQPDLFNAAGATGAALTLVYEHTGSAGRTHVEATSADGVHFTTVGTLSTAGLSSAQATLGDIAYDPGSGYWYGLYDQPLRPPSTTGGFSERGQPGVQLYRTTDLLAGTWQQLDTIDTTATGYEANFIGTLLRDPYGNLTWTSSGSIEMYLSTSIPRPSVTATALQQGQSGDTSYWDIAWSTWTPGQPLRALTRYYSGPSNSPALNRHEVTTGYHDASAFSAESVHLGYLYEAPSGAATRPLYSCKASTEDWFVSLDPGCEGYLTLGLLGYAYPSPPAGVTSIPLYRCVIPSVLDHFVSPYANCEGQTTESLLGYSHG